MPTDTDKKSQSRILIAIALFLASITASFLIAFIASQGTSYWVVREPIPEGAKISSDDVALVKIKLARATAGYLPQSASPVGATAERVLEQGEIIHRGALTSSSQREISASLSLAIRSSDIPPSSKVGDMVSIYQVHDARNGEEAILPRLIISNVFLANISGREGNFSGELSITVALHQREIPTLLASTASGRLVIVGSSG